MPKYEKYKVKNTTEAIKSYWLKVGEYINYGIKLKEDHQKENNGCNRI